MNVSLLYCEYFKTMTCCKPLYRRQRKVGEMLVINGVVFKMRHQVAKIRGFENERAIGRKQAFRRLQHFIKIVDVSEDIRANDNGGRAKFSGHLTSALRSEEIAYGRYACVIRYLHDVWGRVDTGNLHTKVPK